MITRLWKAGTTVLKVEAVHGERFSNSIRSQVSMFEYIEVYYNRKRLHSNWDSISPEAFELKSRFSGVSVKSGQDQ